MAPKTVKRILVGCVLFTLGVALGLRPYVNYANGEPRRVALVTNEEQAIQFAEAALYPFLGEADNYGALSAEYDGIFWYVHKLNQNDTTPLFVVIDKRTGRINQLWVGSRK